MGNETFADRYLRSRTGRTLEDLSRLKPLENRLRLREERLLSQYPVRVLGYDMEGNVFFITEQDFVANMEIMGTTRQGKSSLLVKLIRQTRELSDYCVDELGELPVGATLIDPTDNGETAYRVLRYCCATGFNKVLFINPYDFIQYRRVPLIQPLTYSDSPDKWTNAIKENISVGQLKNTVQILFNTQDFSQTPRLESFIPAVHRALYNAGLTILESRFFLYNDRYRAEREEILAKLPAGDWARDELEAVMKLPPTMFRTEISSGKNRFNVFENYLISPLVGSLKPGIDFEKLVAEGWLIIVNLDPQSTWGKDHKPQRLLGTLIINKVADAIHRLKHVGYKGKPWDGKHYMFIDECGDYATSAISDVLDKKPKLGLRLCLAHLGDKQIENEKVLASIKGRTGIKVMFRLQERQERDRMQRDMGYGGQLAEESVSYDLSLLPQRHAAISVASHSPRKIRIEDEIDPEISNKELTSFIVNELYQIPGFYDLDDIEKEISERQTTTDHASAFALRPKQASPTQAQQTRPTESRRTNKHGGDRAPKGKNSRSSQAGAVSGNVPGSTAVLLRRKGRATSKILEDKTKEDE